jgi:hypothetical protein
MKDYRKFADTHDLEEEIRSILKVFAVGSSGR